MSPPTGRQVIIDGEPMVLAPGVKIYDFKNRTILPNRLQRYYYVKFTVDRSEQIARIWIDSDQSTPRPPPTPPEN